MPIFIDRNSYFAIVITAATTFIGIIAIIIRITESNFAIVIVAVITKLHYAAIVIAAVIIVERVATLDIVILTNLTQFVIGQF